MPTAEELLVAIRSEGVSETRQELDGVSQQMEETADQAGSSAEELEGFSNRFEGAITAAVSALAVGAAGLASQVPVLGELFSGVAAVVGAVAFQMDQVLRPVLSPLTKAFFGLSDAIFNLDGAAGDAVGIIGSIITAIVGIGGTIAAVAVQIFGFSTVWGAVSSAVTGAVSAIVGVIGGIPLAIATAIAAIVGFAVAYLTNWRGLRDKTNRIVGEVIDFVVSGFLSLANVALSAITDFVEFAVDRFKAFLSFMSAFASDIAEGASEIGANIITGIIAGIKGLSGLLLNVVKGAINNVIELINTVIDTLPDTVKDNLGISEIDKVSTLGIGGISSGNVTQSSAKDRIDLSGAFGSGETNVNLDGRKVTEDTGRYRSDPSRRRGI